MNLLFIASGDSEGLIWLIVIVLGGIGQIIGAIKKANAKKARAASLAERPKSRVRVQEKAQPATVRSPSTLREFLQSLSEQLTAVQPPAIPKTTTPPDLQFASPDKLEPAAKKVIRRAPISKPAPAPDYSHLQSSKTRFTSKSFHLPSIHLPSAGKYQSSRSIQTSPRIDFDLRSGKDLKRTIVGLTILSPPKALENDPNGLRI